MLSLKFREGKILIYYHILLNDIHRSIQSDELQWHYYNCMQIYCQM